MSSKWIILKLLLLLMIFAVAGGSPAGIVKRAEILPPKSTTNVTDTRNQIIDGQPVSKTSVPDNITSLCDAHLVPHSTANGTVCCVPYFNCGIDKKIPMSATGAQQHCLKDGDTPSFRQCCCALLRHLNDHGIKTCERDGERDKCIQCPTGMVQKNNVSSLNMEEAECYTEENTENCPLDDTKPAGNISGVISCFLRCECQNENCFYGEDPCACELTDPCPMNFTMNRETGRCEPCPWYAYKDYVGCGTCTIIPELWAQRLSHSTTSEAPVKKTFDRATTPPFDTAGEERVPEDKTKDSPTAPLSTTATYLVPETTSKDDLKLLGAIIGSIFVLGLLGILVYCIRKHKQSGSTTQLLQDNNHNNDQQLELPEIQDGFQIQKNHEIRLKKPDDDDDDDIKGNTEGAVGGVDTGSGNLRFQNYSVEEVKDSQENELLLNREQRHSGSSHMHKQNSSNPDVRMKLDSGSDVSQENSSLLEDNRIQIDAKNGARPKTNRLSKLKSEQALPDARSPVKFERCLFKNCTFTGDGKTIIVQNQTKDSSLYSSESGNFSSVDTDIKVPKNARSTYKIDSRHDREAVGGEDRKYENPINSQYELALNVRTSDNGSLEHTTTDNNISVLDTEAQGTKLLHMVEKKVSNVLESEAAKNCKLKNSSAQTSLKENKAESAVTNCGDENVDCQLNSHTSSMNDSLIGKVSKELKASSLEEEVDVDKNQHCYKNPSVELSRLDIKSKDQDLAQTGCASSTTSPTTSGSDSNENKPKFGSNLDIKIEAKDIEQTGCASSATSPTTSGSESDENKPKFGGRRKIKPFSNSDNGNKPMARIEPIRQNSAQETRQDSYREPVQNLSSEQTSRGYPDSHDEHVGLYMSSLGSNSYPILHANLAPSDVANLDDLHNLNFDSTGTEESDSLICSANSGDDSLERNASSCVQREGPEGCSLQDSYSDRHYVERPDLQRTFSKTVEEGEGENLADNIVRNLREETFLKRSVNDSDSRTKTIKDFKSNVVNDIEKEKMKNYAVVVDAGQESKTVIDKDNEIENCTGEENENKLAAKQVEICDSETDIVIKADEVSDGSVELPIDCLENHSSFVSNTDFKTMKNNLRVQVKKESSGEDSDGTNVTDKELETCDPRTDIDTEESVELPMDCLEIDSSCVPNTDRSEILSRLNDQNNKMVVNDDGVDLICSKEESDDGEL